MAECGFCGHEMNEAEGCIPHKVELRDGTVIDAPRHTQVSSLHAGEAAGRCHDCGAEPGGYHHPRCDSARAPGGRQLLTAAKRYFTEQRRPGGGGLTGGL